jgi:hypothetical protein
MVVFAAFAALACCGGACLIILSPAPMGSTMQAMEDFCVWEKNQADAIHPNVPSCEGAQKVSWSEFYNHSDGGP